MSHFDGYSSCNSPNEGVELDGVSTVPCYLKKRRNLTAKETATTRGVIGSAEALMPLRE